MKLRLFILFSCCILASNLSASDPGSDSGSDSDPDFAPIVPAAPLATTRAPLPAPLPIPLPAPNFEHLTYHLYLAKRYTQTALGAIDDASLPHPLNPNRAAHINRIITALNAALNEARTSLGQGEWKKREYPKE